MSMPSKFLALCVALLTSTASFAIADEADPARQLLQAVQDQNTTTYVITRVAAVRFAGLNLTRPGAELNGKPFTITSPDNGEDGLLDFGNQLNVLSVSNGSSLVFQRVSLQGILPNTADISTLAVPTQNAGLSIWPAVTVAPGAVVGFDQANLLYAARWCGHQQLQELLTVMRNRYGSNDIHIVDGTVLYIAVNLSMSLPVMERSSNTSLGYIRMWTSQTRLVCFPDPNYMGGGATPAPSLDIVQSVSTTEQSASKARDSGLPVAAIVCLSVAIPTVALALVAALIALLVRRRRDFRRSCNSSTFTWSTKAAGPHTAHAAEVCSTGCDYGGAGGADSAALSHQRGKTRGHMDSFQDRSWQLRYQAPTDLTIAKQIGQGSFGKVYKAYWQGVPVAVKVVADAAKATSAGCELRRIQQGDLQIATAVNHPNLVATYRIWLDAPCRGAAHQLNPVPGLPTGPGAMAELPDVSLPLPQAAHSHAQLQQRLRAPGPGMPAPCVSNSPDDDSADVATKVPLHSADIVRTTSSLSCYCTSSDSAEKGVHTASVLPSQSVVTQHADMAGSALSTLNAGHTGQQGNGAGLQGRASCGAVAMTHRLPDPAPVSAFGQLSASEGTGDAAAVHPGSLNTANGPIVCHTSSTVAAVNTVIEDHARNIGQRDAMKTLTHNAPESSYGQQCCAMPCCCNCSIAAAGAVLATTHSSGDRTQSEMDTATSPNGPDQTAHVTEKLEQYHLLCTARQQRMACGTTATGCDTSHSPPHKRQDSSFCQCSISRQRHVVSSGTCSAIEATTDASLSCARCHQGVQEHEEGCVDGVPRWQRGEMTPVETYIMMEYCEFGSLRDAIASGKLKSDGGKQDLEKVLLCLRDVAAGIAALHEHNVIHGDIKSANVLLKASRQQGDIRGYVCKVADLGLSRWFGTDGQMTHTITQTIGTIAYQPPEMLQDGKLAKPADVYSLGVLAWELACGRSPFSSHNAGQVFYHVVVLKKREEVPDDVDPELALFMKDCWHPDPSARPTAAVALSRLVNLLRQFQAAGSKGIMGCGAA